MTIQVTLTNPDVASSVLTHNGAWTPDTIIFGFFKSDFDWSTSPSIPNMYFGRCIHDPDTRVKVRVLK